MISPDQIIYDCGNHDFYNSAEARIDQELKRLYANRNTNVSIKFSPSVMNIEVAGVLQKNYMNGGWDVTVRREYTGGITFVFSSRHNYQPSYAPLEWAFSEGSPE